MPIPFAFLLLFPPDARAVPTLPDVLAALEQHNQQYIHSLPNLFCDEHVVSEIKPHRTSFAASRTTVDAVFRIRRPPAARTLADLKESREIKLVDGRPFEDELGLETPVGLPLLILGVFSNALAVFSPAFQPCLDLTLQPVQAADTTLTLTFASKPFARRPAVCADRETSGSAVLDRESLTVLHLERTLADYPILPGFPGSWTWHVDYAAASIAGRDYWLPAHISSRSVTVKGHAELLFDAVYSHYHRLAATSRIVPDSSATPAQTDPP